MRILTESIHNVYSSYRSVEDEIKKYLSMNAGQLQYFSGNQEQVVLAMAAKILKERSVSYSDENNPTFKQIVNVVRKTSEEISSQEEHNRRTEK